MGCSTTFLHRPTRSNRARQESRSSPTAARPSQLARLSSARDYTRPSTLSDVRPFSNRLLWGAYDTPRHVAELERARRVLVLGMRQSAIDAAQMVHEFNPDAEVVMASRTGKLPAVRTEMRESASTVITPAAVIGVPGHGAPEGVARWRHLIMEELRQHEPVGTLFPGRRATASEQLRSDLEHARSATHAWQRIDRNAVTVANTLWPRTPLERRRELTTWFNRFALRYVSEIPASVADRLIESEQQQRLEYVRTDSRGGPSMITRTKWTDGVWDE